MEFQNIGDKDKNIKASIRGTQVTYIRLGIKLTLDFWRPNRKVDDVATHSHAETK